MKGKLIALLIAVVLFVIWVAVFGARLNDLASSKSTEQNAKIPPQFLDKSLFLSPIEQSKEAVNNKITTGLTVPHHLLASDLIAGAFKSASNTKPEKILLISPDHENLGQTNVTIGSKNFSTVFGTLTTDSASTAELKKLDFVKEESFFYREHGLGAELPFIKYYFPDSKIIALTFKTTTSREELDKLTDSLKNMLGPNSLVVQSTDFSHYLNVTIANARDEETIKAISDANYDGILKLNQPDNLDCRPCQYLQSKLQKEFYNSSLQILYHKNSQDYTKDTVDSTTSYIVQAYTK